MIHDSTSELCDWLIGLGAVDFDTMPDELAGIKRLDLSGKSLESLPENFGELNGLVALNLGNNLLASLPASFAKLNALINLDMRRNMFTALPELLSQLPLKSLNFSGNALSDVSALKQCGDLHVLDLSGNALSDVDGSFAALHRLRNLNLSFNYLGDITELPEGLDALELLNLSSNTLTFLPASLCRLSALTKLDVSNNRIKGYDPSIASMELETLDLTSNELGPLKLRGFTDLETLTLDDNPLHSISFDEGFAPGLTSLSCEGCHLGALYLPPSRGLQYLSYSSNLIAEIPAKIAEYTQLKELDLDNNKIATIPSAINALTALQTFYIDANPLDETEISAVRDLGIETCDLDIKSGIVIRKAQYDDLRVMARLLSQLFAIESDFSIDFEKQYQGIKLLFEQSDSDLIVAKYRNSVIGMLTMQRLVSTAEGGYVGLLEDLIIDEEFRKMGVGTRLLREATELAAKRGYTRLQLAADKENAKALYFYRKRGYRKTNLNIYRYSGFDHV